MNVYLHGASYKIAKICGKQTACYLNQQVTLPYFKAFEQELLGLADLYQQIDQQIQQVMIEAGWQAYELKDIPIFLGSTGYTISIYEAMLAQQQTVAINYSIASIADYLRERYQTQVFSLSTSCTSSAQGIYYAYQMLKSGQCERALVLGFESFNHLTFDHFYAMNLLATELPYQPLSYSNGIVLGEGIGCLALSNRAMDRFVCELSAMVRVTDHKNLTNVDETLFERLLSDILDQANLAPSQLNGVKVHGVGGNSDELETRLLQRLFPTNAWLNLKAYMGHTLGASGVLETAFLLDCLQQGNQSVLQKNPLNRPLVSPQTQKDAHYLCYFLGFGGNHLGWLMKWARA